MKLLVALLVLCISIHCPCQERQATGMIIPNIIGSDLSSIKKTLEKELYLIDRISLSNGYIKTYPKRMFESPTYIVGLKIQLEGIITEKGLYIYAIYWYNAKRKTGCTNGYCGLARKVAYKKAGCRVAFDELNRVAQIISPELVYIKE